jgi:hypothetical protein
MKRLLAIVAVVALGGLAAMAQDKPEDKPQAKPAEHDHGAAHAPVNPQFEALKKLEGTWTGKSSHGEGDNDSAVVYKVTAAGSAVMETLFPGTEHEMVTMYSMDGNDLVLTHYCALGNQPHMKLVKSDDPKTLAFECNGHGGNMKESDMHMHSAKMTIVDNDHIKSAWTMSVDKKPGETATFDMTRK